MQQDHVPVVRETGRQQCTLVSWIEANSIYNIQTGIFSLNFNFQTKLRITDVKLSQQEKNTSYNTFERSTTILPSFRIIPITCANLTGRAHFIIT